MARKRRMRKVKGAKLRKDPRKIIRGLRPKAPYRSLFEEKLAYELKELASGAAYEAEKLPYIITGNYVPDWTLPNNVIIEAKGVLDYAAKRKLLAVKKAHPHRTICIIFQRASNKFNKKSATYGEWASRNGFLWSDGTINEEWFKLPKVAR